MDCYQVTEVQECSDKMLKLLSMYKIKTCINFFFSLVWMSLLIYYMLGQLINRDHHAPKKLSQDIYFNGQPSSLMAEIGFMGNPRYYPQAYQEEHDLPVFILPLHSSHMQEFFGFLLSFRKYYLHRILVIYDLGLLPQHLFMVQKHCKCMVRTVRWNRYPKHVSNLKLKAYLPLIIQETLHEFGAVFYCDVGMRFSNSGLDPEVTTHAFIYGFATWPTQDSYPTSTFTHYNMFRFFSTSHQNFYFHRMVNPNIALLYNTKAIHNNLMLPWVKCALDYDCLTPIGAQTHGCSFLHKPKYIYAGCHKYDISPFNVLAGLMFNFTSPYITGKSIFYIEQPWEVEQNFNMSSIDI